jgi:hypothetical protein
MEVLHKNTDLRDDNSISEVAAFRQDISCCFSVRSADSSLRQPNETVQGLAQLHI